MAGLVGVGERGRLGMCLVGGATAVLAVLELLAVLAMAGLGGL
jgi:hypothetical protein